MIEFDLITDKAKSPDMTPMIDMVFLLLIFFLLTSVFRVPVIATDLPSSSARETVKPDVFVVSLKESGEIYFNEKAVGVERLKELMQRALVGKKEKDVSIASDKGVSFDRIVAVMNAAKEAGAESVSFLTDDEQK